VTLVGGVGHWIPDMDPDLVVGVVMDRLADHYS
jgi:hypothetical protein